MFEETNAAQIHCVGGPESFASEAKAITDAEASPASQTSRPASFVELRNTLPSHVDIISPFVDGLMRFISRFRVADGNNVEIELALREAIANAIVHGNQEDPHKRVYVKCRCTGDGEVSVTVEDEGHGFNHGTAYHLIPAVFALALMIFLITRRKPVLSGVLRALGKRAPSWLLRAEEFESSIRNYRFHQPALVSRMFWIDIACQALIASEVVVVLWSLHLPIHFFTILVIEGVTRGLKMLSGWIPARLGSDEGGAISAFALTGLSPMRCSAHLSLEVTAGSGYRTTPALVAIWQQPASQIFIFPDRIAVPDSCLEISQSELRNESALPWLRSSF